MASIDSPKMHRKYASQAWVKQGIELVAMANEFVNELDYYAENFGAAQLPMSGRDADRLGKLLEHFGDTRFDLRSKLVERMKISYSQGEYSLERKRAKRNGGIPS